jgi:hypothetical protein
VRYCYDNEEPIVRDALLHLQATTALVLLRVEPNSDVGIQRYTARVEAQSRR